MKESYSRKELEHINDDEFPSRGPVCQRCNTHIPVFEDLNAADSARIKALSIQGQKILAMKELSALTGCNKRWAKIWVLHNGTPNWDIKPTLCPYCGKYLRTSRAKMCVECGMDWHDENNIYRIGKN